MKVYLIPSNNKEWRGLVKELLKRDYNVTNDACFIYNEYGKPYLKDNDYFFNISHSGNYLVIAISKYEVGVDIEEVKERSRMDLIAKKTFFDKEIEEYENSQGSIDYFYQIWTKKEAYVKMKGTGINGYFNNLDQDYCNYIETKELMLDNVKYYLSIATLSNNERNNMEIYYE